MGRFRTKRISRKPRYFQLKRRPSAWFLAFMILVALLFQAGWIMESNIQPMLLVIGKTEVKKVAQEAMLKGIQEMQKSLGEDLNKTIAIEKGSDGRITFIRVNTNVQTRIYGEMTSYIQAELKHLENRKIGMTVGQIMQSNMFANYGPRIPLEIWPKGSTNVSISPKLESQGVNMTMVTLNVHVKNDMDMIVPFSKENVEVSFDYPIAQALVVGEVPQYYFYNDQGAVKKRQAMPSLPQIPQSPRS